MRNRNKSHKAHTATELTRSEILQMFSDHVVARWDLRYLLTDERTAQSFSVAKSKIG